MVKNSAVADRIQQLLDGRDKYPWAKSIGIETAIDSITRLGRTPSGDTMSAIRRVENVRTDWLLEGRGSPYFVSVFPSDDDASREINELTDPEKWEVTLVSDGTRIAAILNQPGSFAVKDQQIDYTIIEVIAGPLGPKTLSTIRNRWMHNIGISAVNYVHLTSEVMSRIERGEVGTYRLFNAEDAILKGRVPIIAEHPLFVGFSKLGSVATTPEEAALIDRYRSMSPVNRLAVNQVISAMATDVPDKGTGQ